MTGKQMQANKRPPITVVVAAWAGETKLAQCLASLRAQSYESAEVIAACSLPEESVERLQTQFAQVQFVRGPRDATVFELRSIGVHASTGRVIALIEDHTTVCTGWIESLLAAHGDGHSIVGGAVDNGLTQTAFDWALYFCEYGYYMPNVTSGKTTILSGLNIAYDRQALFDHREVWDSELYETDVNAALAEAGAELYQVADGTVKSHLEMPFGFALRHLFAGGRHFGTLRGATSPLPMRVLLVLLSPIVPVVLLARIFYRAATRRPDWIWRVIQCFPILVAFLVSWGIGEAVGYLTGLVKPDCSTSTRKA